MSLYVSFCCRYHSLLETQILTSWLRSLRLLGQPRKKLGLLVSVFFPPSYFCDCICSGQMVRILAYISLQGVSSLPDYVSFKIFPGTPLEHIFSAAGDDLLELLQGLFTFNPSTRNTATQVMSTLKPSSDYATKVAMQFTLHNSSYYTTAWQRGVTHNMIFLQEKPPTSMSVISTHPRLWLAGVVDAATSLSNCVIEEWFICSSFEEIKISTTMKYYTFVCSCPGSEDELLQ